MISQLSKTVSNVILSFSEHVLIFRKIMSFLLVFWKYAISLQFWKIWKILSKTTMGMIDTDLESWDLILFNKKILVNTCWLLLSWNWLWRCVNLAKIYDFTEFGFHQIVNGGQQMLTKVALVKNMLSQLSKTVSEVILSFPEHFLISLKNTSFLCTKLCRNSQEKIFIG